MLGAALNQPQLEAKYDYVSARAQLTVSKAFLRRR